MFVKYRDGSIFGGVRVGWCVWWAVFLDGTGADVAAWRLESPVWEEEYWVCDQRAVTLCVVGA